MTERDETAPGRLDQPIAALQPTPRARAVCERLGVETVAQFLATPRAKFLAQQGCGERTYAALERRVVEWLARTAAGTDTATTKDDDRPVLGFVRGPAAEKAFLALGITTVGEFLAAKKEELLAYEGFGERTYQRILDAVRATRPVRAAAKQLLPESLLGLQLDEAALPPPLVAKLRELGCADLGQVFALPDDVFGEDGELGPEASGTIRECLDRVVRTGFAHLQTLPDPTTEWPTIQGRLLAPLNDTERELFAQLLGPGGSPKPPAELAIARGIEARAIEAELDGLRCRLHDCAPSILCRLRYEAARELEANEGVVNGDSLAAGSLLHVMAKGTGDRQFALRLCAFCFPLDFQLHEGCLTVLPPETFAQFLKQLRRLTAAAALPVELDTLARELCSVVDPVPRGLLVHLLRTTCRLGLELDPKRGELVVPGTHSVAGRLREVFAEESRPLLLEDVVFHYRDRYRSANALRIERALRSDPAFLEVGKARWSLRAWHEDELETVRPLAGRAVVELLRAGGKQSVAGLLRDGDRTERVEWLVLDCLRHDPRVRYLGRGELCPATQTCSQVLEQLLKDFKRAAGEVVLSRFLANQPPERVRLVRRLLLENRLFVMPNPDRVDLLTNYPFNEERLDQLLDVVRRFLDKRSGYAPLSAVLAEVNRGELGGSWMNDVLLGELLRRHGSFDLLAGGFAAKRELRLAGWLLHKVRTLLRQVPGPLTVGDILRERPELAEFTDCLAALLRLDPMVQTPDGTRFALV